MLYNKFAQAFKKKALQICNIQALWQQNKDLDIISQTNSLVKLE